MSADLRERLDRLASAAPRSVPPRDLWAKGVRRRRRTVVALSATAAGIALVAAVGGTVWWRVAPPPLPAASTRGAPAIPDRISTPSPWSAGTTDAGPLGQLAVLASAPRHTGLFSKHSAPFGISATTGAYRFLDLPDLTTDGGTADPVLSPDGRHIAYWLQGRTRLSGRGVVGFASYDTSTGRVVRHLVSSPAGLASETLGWFGQGRVVVGWSRVVRITPNGSMVTRGSSTNLWSPATGALMSFDRGESTLGHWGSARRPVSWPGGGRRFWVWNLRTASATAYRLPTGALQAVSVSPDGRRAALDLATLQPLVVDLPPGGGAVRVRGVEGFVAGQPLGWQDDDHVAYVQAPGLENRVRRVDLRTHTSRLVLRSSRFLAEGVVAGDLWSHPLISRPAPARVLGPWVTAAGLGLVGFAACCLLLEIRSRRRVRT